MKENIRKCKWCGGVAKKLWQHDGCSWWDDFSFNQSPFDRVRIFICHDCGKVQFEDYNEKKYTIHIAEA